MMVKLETVKAVGREFSQLRFLYFDSFFFILVPSFLLDDFISNRKLGILCFLGRMWFSSGEQMCVLALILKTCRYMRTVFW